MVALEDKQHDVVHVARNALYGICEDYEQKLEDLLEVSLNEKSNFNSEIELIQIIILKELYLIRNRLDKKMQDILIKLFLTSDILLKSKTIGLIEKIPVPLDLEYKQQLIPELIETVFISCRELFNKTAFPLPWFLLEISFNFSLSFEFKFKDVTYC